MCLGAERHGDLDVLAHPIAVSVRGVRGDRHAGDAERPIHLVVGVIGNAGVVPGYRNRPQLCAGRGQPTAEAGGRAAHVHADAARIEVGELHPVAVDQLIRPGAGDVARRPVVAGGVPDPNGDHGVFRRICLRAEGQRDVDIFPHSVTVFMRRIRGDRDAGDMERPVHLVMVVIRQTGVVVDHRQQAEAGDDGRHRPAEAAVRAADADAVRVGIVKLHLVAVHQPVGLRAGVVLRRAVVGTVGRVADADRDDRTARRHVDRGIEGQRNVDVVSVVVGAAAARRRHDLRPMGAVGARAPPDPDPERPFRCPNPVPAGRPKQQMILNGPSGLATPILEIAGRVTELDPIVIGAAGDAIEHQVVVRIRLQKGVGRCPPLIVREVVQPTSGEGSDLRAQSRAAVQVGVYRHVPALVRLSLVQPDTLQFIPTGNRSGPEPLCQPVLDVGQNNRAGSQRLVHVLDQRGDRRIVLLRGRSRGADQRGQAGKQHRPGAQCATRRPRQRAGDADD